LGRSNACRLQDDRAGGPRGRRVEGRHQLTDAGEVARRIRDGRVCYVEPAQRWLSGGRLRFGVILLVLAAFYALCLHYAEIDLVRLWHGLPKFIRWTAQAWPPDLAELNLLLFRAAQTVAMATIGTTLAIVMAAPLCLLAARNVTLEGIAYYPARWLLDFLRGIDSFVFALLFVAAVGLGPFAGVLGVGLHSAGSVAKLWSEAIEATEPGPLEAVAMTGAGRLKIVFYALLPDVLPALLSTGLYVWEFNIRSSTVLGLVGAGGIGQDLKNAVDLLDFPSVTTIILIILAMVTAVDQLSAWLRRRVL
jgi:phosphonate transport system permease protein